MTPPRTLSADLLFTRAPTLMPQAVFLKVKELLPGIELTAPTPQSPAARFRHPGTALETLFIVSDQPPPPGAYADALVSEEDWPGAMTIAAQVRSTVTLAELNEQDVEPATRLEIFAKVLAGCARALYGEGAYLKPAQKLVSPATIEQLARDAQARTTVFDGSERG